MAPTVTVLVLALASVGLSMSVARQEQELAQNYLTKFGYLRDKSSDQMASLVSIDSAVRDFQAFAGLEQTGKLDKETMVMMRTPRCGVKDVFQEEEEDTPRMQGLERDKRYALQGSRWKEKDLTYRVSKYPVRSGLSRRQVDETMEKAFKIWEKAMPLKFTKQKSGKVHIDIRFERRSHGDKDSFDGRGGTLAHAFFPVYGGDVHIDDDEDWTVNTARGTSLLMTTTHELGHSLGLSHSNNRNSLMAPFYRIYEPNLALKTDDVRGIQSLYGRNTDTSRNEVGLRSFIPSSIPQTTKRTTKRTTQPTTRHPATTQRTFFNYRPTLESDSGTSFLCSRGQLDTLVTMKDSVTYAFLGSQYWKLTETSVEPGYPRSISSDWDGLPGKLDASFTWINGKTYFFKGSKYWRFSDGGKMDSGYPKELGEGFSGIPNSVDAAFVWPVNDKIYFFKDSTYWKFDPDLSPPIDSSYPRPISKWDGIPNNLDSALQYSNGKSYFFKSGRYYRFDDKKFTLDTSADPPFPRETGFWWFGCPANSVRLTKQEDVI